MSDRRSARERAKVEAWMLEGCPHGGYMMGPGISRPRQKAECPDCLLVYAAERVREENEACTAILESHGCLCHEPNTPRGTCPHELAEELRARREDRK